MGIYSAKQNKSREILRSRISLKVRKFPKGISLTLLQIPEGNLHIRNFPEGEIPHPILRRRMG